MEYISDRRDKWPVSWLCTAMAVSESAFYRYLKRPAKPCRHADLLAQIYEVLREDEENSSYGVQRIYMALTNTKGYTGSYSTVLRVCRENGLIIKRKKRPVSLTTQDPKAQKSENLIDQDFTASEPNSKWLTDITEIACQDGRLYLAAILDCFDGKIVGFAMDTNMKATLCASAFRSACRSENASGMLCHSDRGSQFTSRLFRETLARYGATQSMSGTGNCFDNARMESWFATLKKEKIHRLNTKASTRMQWELVSIKSGTRFA